jgi:hypothetical protein
LPQLLELIAGIDDDRYRVDTRIRRVQIAVPQGLDSPDEIGERTGSQTVGGVGDLFRGIGVNGYTGIVGVNLQDQAVTESMGPTYDRTSEHLGSSDAMIIRVRRRLLDAARALDERGVTPPGVDDPDAYLVRAGGVILPTTADWIEATTDLRVPFSEHLELDPSIEGRL